MTMDQLYLPITLILIAAVLIRLPSALRYREARAAWLATLFAVPALLSRGAVVPIETLDGWMGGQNLIFLVQCWFATLAFWALGEAAGADGSAGRRDLRLYIPLLWCIVYTVPFFFITDRTPTELFFIDAHVADLAAILCGSLYIIGIAATCVLLLWRLRNRHAPAHWVFRVGAVLIAAGSLLWMLAIIIHHAYDLDRESILWMYLGFDVLFYPGVVVLALALMVFAAQRSIRRITARRRIAQLQRILTSRSLAAVDGDDDLSFWIYSLLVQIQDLRTLGALAPTPDEQRLIETTVAWTERTFPQVKTISEPAS